jgi:glutamate/tyrosine decarboxylase-like PLP-dependent enzyme
MGGFVLPFAEMLGRGVDPWDFRVEGVTSISADIHKLG